MGAAEAEATKADHQVVAGGTSSGIATTPEVAIVIEEDQVGVAAAMETKTLATIEARLEVKKNDRTVEGMSHPTLNPSTLETILVAALAVMSLGQVAAAAAMETTDEVTARS